MFFGTMLMIEMADVRTIITALYFLIVISTIVIIIHDRRDPVKALSWIMVISLIPVFGLVVYMFFGRNYRKEKMFNLKEIADLASIEELSREQLQDLSNPRIQYIESIDDNKDIIKLLLNNSKSVLTVRNKIKILNGGREKFKELFEAVRNATSSIHLEYYILENDRIGRRLCNLLKERAREGVEVRFIYDDVGSWNLKRKYVKELRDAGIDIRPFMPVAFPWFTSKANYRNHRKIVVIDGKIGFTGGLNIAERYLKGTKIGPWRDTHLRIEGDAVNALQAVFVTDWYFVSDKELLADDKYFPQSRINTQSPVQIAVSGPDSDWASIMQAFFAAMTKAQRSIHIITPYFLPNQAILTALKVAALSGVDVKIILPYKSDSKVTHWASRSYISELLEAGIKVYFYCKGFNHSKILIVDDIFASVGSANMDMRSFEDNFEVSALMYDKRIVEELNVMFERDLDNSVLITKGAWAERSNLHAAYESLARLFSPLL